MIPGTKSSLYVEEIFEFSDILYGTLSLSLVSTTAAVMYGSSLCAARY